jgi:hypothetical protein
METVSPDCPSCSQHDRVFGLYDLVDGMYPGWPGEPPIARERLARLRKDVAPSGSSSTFTVTNALRVYTMLASVAHLFGLRLPHFRKGTYAGLAALCGIFALVFLTLVGEKPVQAIVVSLVFGALCIFFIFRWRDSDRREQQRIASQEQARATGLQALSYCDRCERVFAAGSTVTMLPTMVQGYLATGRVSSSVS